MSVCEGWTEKPLGRVASVTMGQSPDSKYYTGDEASWPFLQGCAEFRARFPAPKLFCSIRQKAAKEGSLLFSVRAPVGRINIADREYVIGRGLAAIEGVEVASAYLEQYLAFITPSLRSASQGSTFEAISSSELRNWPIAYPSKTCEQGKIAEILSTVDLAIEQTEAVIAKQQQIKTGLMRDLLTRGLDERGILRSEVTHKFKDSPLGRMPIEWEAVPLSRAIEIIDCKHYTPAYADEGIPIVRPRNIKESGLDMNDLDYVTEKDYLLLTDKHEPSDGDIVFSRNASFGVPVYLEGMGRLCIGQDVVVMRKKAANSRFIFFSLKSDSVVRQIANASGGSTFGRIDLAAIRSLLIPLPASDDEQQAIAMRLHACDEFTRALSVKFDKLQSLKTALMQDLLTGKKRVTDLLELDPERENVYASQ